MIPTQTKRLLNHLKGVSCYVILCYVKLTKFLTLPYMQDAKKTERRQTQQSLQWLHNVNEDTGRIEYAIYDSTGHDKVDIWPMIMDIEMLTINE